MKRLSSQCSGDDVYHKIAIIKGYCLLTDPPTIMPKTSIQSGQCQSAESRTIVAFIQWLSSFEVMKKLFHAVPLKWTDNYSEAMGNYEKLTRLTWSVKLIWFWMNSSLIWMCSKTFVDKESWKQQYIQYFNHLIFDILGEAELHLQSERSEKLCISLM